MCHLSSAETNRSLDLVAVRQETLGVIELDVVVVNADTNAELHFLDGNNMLILTGFLLTLGLFKLELAVVHDLTDRGHCLRRNLHQIQTAVDGNTHGILNRHDTQLRTVGVNETNFFVTDFLVNLMLSVTDVQTPPKNKKERPAPQPFRYNMRKDRP